jgi:glycosyltransferase involved in cell wall biosynthesis
MRFAARVLPVSQSLQKAIEGYGIRANFQVVPNVVDTNLFFPASRPRESNGAKRLLFVGLLDAGHKKGIPYLLRALAKLRLQRQDWELEVVGSGEAQKEYEQLAIDLNIVDKVRFLGSKPKARVAEIMRRTDLFVLPSVFETFSVVTIEAMATGLPVLVTRCGGPEEYVTDAVGRIVPPCDADALADGLADMLDRLGEFSRKVIRDYAVERFSFELIGRMLHEVFVSVKRK